MDYKKVIQDFNNGTIDKSKWIVVMDNDGGYWRFTGHDDLDLDAHDALEEWRDAETKKMSKRYGRPEGYGDIVDVLNAAGVEAEWC